MAKFRFWKRPFLSLSAVFTMVFTLSSSVDAMAWGWPQIARAPKLIGNFKEGASMFVTQIQTKSLPPGMICVVWGMSP